VRASINAKLRLAVACLLVLSALVSGCQSRIEGKPVATPVSPTEPSFPTPRPTVSTPTTPAPSRTSPPTAAPPVGAVPLPPDNSGYVFIATKSGQTRCQISTTTVGCEAPFTNTPFKDGVRANGVNVTSGGAVEWIVGNLGDIPVVTIDYRTYSAVGWTIVATSDGTRFTNDRTGHGALVSIDKVEAY
jgi:hypothetical protein